MVTHQNDSEDWKDFNREGQDRKARKRAELTEMVERFCVNNSIHLEKFTPYQFRLSKSMFNKVDVYVTSSQVRVLKKGEKSKTVDLYRWLQKYFGVVNEKTQ